MLNIQDIQNQQFHVRFRGFDVEEVDEFLEQATATVQALSDENKELKEKLEEAERKVAAYKRQEKSTMNAIVSAQNVAQEMKEKAREEARELLSKAREEARGLEESAGREIADLEREVDRLKGLKAQIREEVRQTLTSYLAGLDRELADEDRDTDPSSGQKVARSGGLNAEADGLYQRITLSDEGLPSPPATAGRSGAETAADLAGPSIPTSGSASGSASGPTPTAIAAKPPTPRPSPPAEESTLPDLDGDMVFTLEDPLDEMDEENHDGIASSISLENEPEPERKE